MLGVARSGPSLEVIAQADGPRLLGLTHWVGREVELHASAAGKLVLAELSEAALDAWIRRERPRRLTPRTIIARAEITPRSAGYANGDGRARPRVGDRPRLDRLGDPRCRRALAPILGFSGPSERLDYPALLAHLEQGGGALRTSHLMTCQCR